MKTIGWLIRFGLDRICVLVWVQIGDHRCVCCVGAYGVKQSQCSSVRIKTLSRGNLFCDEPVAIKGLLTLSLGELPQQHVALHPGQASLHPLLLHIYQQPPKLLQEQRSCALIISVCCYATMSHIPSGAVHNRFLIY